MTLLKKNLRLSIFPGQGATPGLEEDRELAYRCWRSVWVEVFQDEMKLEQRLYSDDFTRQEIIVSLFFGGSCVGLAMIRLLPVNSERTFDDSFFRLWTPESLKEISRLSGDSPLALASSFTLHPEFRGRSQFINWKTLLLALFLEKFLGTEARIMVTAARKKRSNEKLCQSLGARLLERDVSFHREGHKIASETADLLYWPRNLFLDLGSSELNELKNQIWLNRSDLCDYQGERHAA